MTALEVIPLFLAGLTFFFLGLDSIRSSLKSLASRSMRKQAAIATASPLRAAILGFGFGLVSQSATAVSFLLAGLLSARLLTMQRALTVVAWANPGTALLAFLAAINLNLAILWLIGLTGLALRQRRWIAWAPTLGTMLGVGLLLFGLIQLKRAVSPLHEAEWFSAVGAALNGSLVLGFIAGALLRVIIQSSSGIVVILIALCGKGILEPQQAMMVIHGTGVGVGLSIILLGQGLRGDSLRIAYWQAIINAISSCLLAGWLLIAATEIIPSIIDILKTSGLSIETTLALGFLLQMLMCPLIGWMMRHRAKSLLPKLVPDIAEDILANPHFLVEGGVDSPEIAAELVKNEQLRVIAALPTLLDAGRLDKDASQGHDVNLVLESLASLNAEISAFILECVEQTPHDDENRFLLVNALGSQQVLAEIVTAIDSLGKEVGALDSEPAARELGGRLVEVCDVMVRSMHDAIQSKDEFDLEILSGMTSDRGEQMENIRRRSATLEFGSPKAQAGILFATSVFERIAYLMRRMTT